MMSPLKRGCHIKHENAILHIDLHKYALYNRGVPIIGTDGIVA